MMTRSLSLSLLLALGTGLGGCAANVVDDDDGNGGGGGSGGGDGEIVPLSAEGKYAMQSTFDIATNMPGTAGAVVNAFIDATDSPDDPTHWILDQIVAKLPDGSIKNAVQGAIPFAAGYLNDRLLDVAPDFVVTIKDLGTKFGLVARNFGTMETLEVAAGGQATKIVTGFEFKIDQIDLQYAFKDYNMAEITIPALAIGLDATGRLTIPDHKIPLSYGKVLRVALDEVVIPMVDPTAFNLEDVLKHLVNCQAVGQYLYEALDIGSASTFQGACTAGLSGGSSMLYGLLNKVDSSALEFGINGVARGVDTNHDGKMDKIQTGAWAGTLAYGGTGAPLAKGNFVGQRM
jgi:hypothetical protein